MGKLYAYARVSSQSQRLDRQIRNILNYLGEDRALTKLFKEKYTGTKLDRPEFQKLLKILKPGDTVIFDSVSRMSRNAEEGFQLYMELLEMGINLSLLMSRTLIPIITKRCRQKRLPLQNPAGNPDDEREKSVVTDRGTKADRKANGCFGQDKKSVEMKNRIVKMSKCFSGNMSDKECMEILQIARNTFYKYKRELLAEAEDAGSTVE